jgi:hypothetical protein
MAGLIGLFMIGVIFISSVGTINRIGVAIPKDVLLTLFPKRSKPCELF